MHTLTDALAFTQLLAAGLKGAGTTSYTSAYLPMTEFGFITFLLDLGANATSSGIVDVSILQATSSTGAGSKAITSATLVDISATAGGSTLHAITVQASKLDIQNGFNHVAADAHIANSTGGIGMGIVALRYGARNQPTSNGLTQDVLVVG